MVHLINVHFVLFIVTKSLHSSSTRQLWSLSVVSWLGKKLFSLSEIWFLIYFQLITLLYVNNMLDLETRQRTEKKKSSLSSTVITLGKSGSSGTDCSVALQWQEGRRHWLRGCYSVNLYHITNLTHESNIDKTHDMESPPCSVGVAQSKDWSGHASPHLGGSDQDAPFLAMRVHCSNVFFIVFNSVPALCLFCDNTCFGRD